MSEIKKIIFDTDLGGDCDDVTALDLMLSAHKRGECQLLGVMYDYTSPAAPACIYAILREHGCEDIPISRLTLPAEKFHVGCYAEAVAEKFAADSGVTYESTPDAVELYKKLLGKNDHVTIIATGSTSVLAELLRDEEGYAAVRDHVDEIAIMACNFWHENCHNPDPGYIAADGSVVAVAEWNIFCDIPSAQYIFDNCPVPIVLSPFELGFNMFSGAPMVEHGKGETADSLSFIVHGAGYHGQHSWDPTTALYGIYGAAPWFYVSVGGKVTIDDKGVSHFNTLGGGKHRILQCAKQPQEIAAEIDRIVMRLFD